MGGGLKYTHIFSAVTVLVVATAAGTTVFFVLFCLVMANPCAHLFFFLPLSWRLNSNIDDSDDAWELWREGLYVSVGINKGMFSTCEFF